MLTFGRVSHTELHSQRELPALSLSALKDCLYNFYCTGTLLFFFFSLKNSSLGAFLLFYYYTRVCAYREKRLW